jgi:hypothetical protein
MTSEKEALSMAIAKLAFDARFQEIHTSYQLFGKIAHA